MVFNSVHSRRLCRSLGDLMVAMASRPSAVIGASSASPSTIAGPLFQQCRGASKKQGGSTQNTKDSLPKFLGIKLYGGQRCVPGNIIIRQRGTEFHPGVGVGMGRDHTIYALIEGNVKFFKDRRRNRRIINVLPPQLATS